MSPVSRAIGHPDVTWKLNLVRLIVSVSLLVCASNFGIVSVARAQVAVAAVAVPMISLVLARILRPSGGRRCRI